MRIAIIGAGISGLVCAWLLRNDHDVVLFEAADRPGGHAHTVDVDAAGKSWAVDTGFVVFNDRTYPNFRRLLDRLGVAAQPTSMSFAVRCERTGLEYNGTSLDTLFAQRTNLVRPSFWRMIRGILRFHREAPALLDGGDDDLTLGEYLERGRYAREFVEHYILPMGGAIWSASKARMREFPARFFVRFFSNHGMLAVNDRPQWYVVRGGSRRYVDAIARALGDRLRTSAPVERLQRDAGGVRVFTARGGEESFQKAILACHSDQALALLDAPTADERAVLSSIGYQENVEVLHCDPALLPRKKRARAAWNAILPAREPDRVAVTYCANVLQSLDCPVPLALTLNHVDAIDPSRIFRRFVYHHPIYTPRVPAAQARHEHLNGKRHTYFCGAYWGFGFHEDGVKSALAVTRHFGHPTID